MLVPRWAKNSLAYDFHHKWNGHTAILVKYSVAEALEGSRKGSWADSGLGRDR